MGGVEPAGRDVVDTGSNTMRDSLALVGERAASAGAAGRAVRRRRLHRYELLNEPARCLTATLEALARAAERTPLAVRRPLGDRRGARALRARRLFDETRVRRVPRLPFFDFVRVERASAFVVTDSGGSQEECFYLDRPCLVHRVRTERREGLGENAVLSGHATERSESSSRPDAVPPHGPAPAGLAVGRDRRRPRASADGRLTSRAA